jgi:hypothetical protein
MVVFTAVFRPAHLLGTSSADASACQLLLLRTAVCSALVNLFDGSDFGSPFREDFAGLLESQEARLLLLRNGNAEFGREGGRLYPLLSLVRAAICFCARIS